MWGTMNYSANLSFPYQPVRRTYLEAAANSAGFHAELRDLEEHELEEVHGAWVLGAAAGAIGGGALGYTISAGWSPTAVKISVGVGVVVGGILGALAPV
jgi:hypothetical protein